MMKFISPAAFLFLFSLFVSLSLAGYCPILVDEKIYCHRCASQNSTATSAQSGSVSVTNINGTAIAWFSLDFISFDSGITISVSYGNSNPFNQSYLASTAVVFDLGSGNLPLQLSETITVSDSVTGKDVVNVTAGYYFIEVTPSVSASFDSISSSLVSAQYFAVTSNGTIDDNEVLLHPRITGGMTQIVYGNPQHAPAFPHACVAKNNNVTLNCLINATQIALEDQEDLVPPFWFSLSSGIYSVPVNFSVFVDEMIQAPFDPVISLISSVPVYGGVYSMFHNIETFQDFSFETHFVFNVYNRTQAFYYVDPLFDLLTSRALAKFAQLDSGNDISSGVLSFSVCTGDSDCGVDDCAHDLKKRTPVKPNSPLVLSIDATQASPSYGSIFFDPNNNASVFQNISFNLEQCSNSKQYSNAYVLFAVQSTDLTLGQATEYLAFDFTYFDFEYGTQSSEATSFIDILTVTAENSTFDSVCLYHQGADHSMVINYCGETQQALVNGSASFNLTKYVDDYSFDGVEDWTIKLFSVNGSSVFVFTPATFVLTAEVARSGGGSSDEDTDGDKSSGGWLKWVILVVLSLLVILGIVGAVGAAIYIKKKNQQSQLDDEEVLVSGDDGYGFDDE